MRFSNALATLALIGAVLPATGLAQSTTADTTVEARRARIRAAMAVAKARAESAAKLVTSMVVRPAYLELNVGDSVYSSDLYNQLQVLGVTAAGDTISDFAKSFALEPSPYLERRGHDLVARRSGIATLWIYVGVDVMRRLFTDTTGVVRVQLRVK